MAQLGAWHIVNKHGTKTVASDCLELAATLLASADNAHILKLVIQCFCHIYPLLFRIM